VDVRGVRHHFISGDRLILLGDRSGAQPTYCEARDQDQREYGSK
jgi:hypothetical protein